MFSYFAMNAQIFYEDLEIETIKNLLLDLKIKLNDDKTFRINICEHGLHADCGRESKKFVSVCGENGNDDESKSPKIEVQIIANCLSIPFKYLLNPQIIQTKQ